MFEEAGADVAGAWELGAQTDWRPEGEGAGPAELLQELRGRVQQRGATQPNDHTAGVNDGLEFLNSNQRRVDGSRKSLY